MNRYQKMKLRMESVKRGISHTLNIGYTGTICYDVLAEALRRIYKRNPQIQISMIQNESSELNKNIMNGNLDVAFTLKLERKKVDVLVWETVEKGELLCLVNDEHPLGRRAGICMEDLANERLIVPPRISCPILTDYINGLFHKKNIEPNFMTIQEQQDIRFFVKSGFGIALMTDCTRDQKVSGIRLLPVKESNENFNVIVTWKEDNDNPSVQMLLNEIKQQKIQKNDK
jgi:DNA-binding transcriptional LysR family regulator